ncbi:MAG: hypothetical protein QOJ99_1988 [Bryobacterales bacterium]|nr:hypothetical protein [Bryobacterales bacterium]
MTVQTNDAIRRQIEAMQTAVFELGLYKPAGAADRHNAPEMIPRSWDTDTLLKSIAWLRLQNLRGRNIYIRPKGEHSLSLVDDLSRSAIERMKVEGFHPAAVIETSPRNFQAWLNHGHILPKEIGTAAARSLAGQFGGDTKAADWRHYGRLAGFTNQKPKHKQSNGLFPFVKLIEATGAVYPMAENFISNIREQCEKDERLRRDRAASFVPSRPFYTPPKSIEAFRLNPDYGGDGTRVDLAYALYAFSRGVNESDVKAAIASRDLSHKGSERRQHEYIERTIRKALALRHHSPTLQR